MADTAQTITTKAPVADKNNAQKKISVSAFIVNSKHYLRDLRSGKMPRIELESEQGLLIVEYVEQSRFLSARVLSQTFSTAYENVAINGHASSLFTVDAGNDGNLIGQLARPANPRKPKPAEVTAA